MDKYLIINADDFGMCRAHHIATVDLFAKGTVTSATVMAPCAYAREAVDFAIRNPSLSVGVHLTTTAEWKSYRWGPVSKEVGSLVDSEGFFYRNSTEFANHASPQDTETELIAQIEHLRSIGLSPSHLDNHMGSLYGVATGDFTFLKIAIDIAGRYGLPFRFPAKLSDAMFSNGTLDIKISPQTVRDLLENFTSMAKSQGVITPDYLIPGDWNGDQSKSFENYKEYIFELYRTFDNGITETYIHPAIECDEIKNITPCWERRVWEHRLFSDPKTLDFIKSLGIKLIGYRELKQIKTSQQTIQP